MKTLQQLNNALDFLSRLTLRIGWLIVLLNLLVLFASACHQERCIKWKTERKVVWVDPEHKTTSRTEVVKTCEAWR